MATIKQRKAVGKIMENHGNISKSMREVGYSESTASNPKNLTDSKGFKELCEEIGLTKEFILSGIYRDINELEAKERLGHLNLASKVLGLFKENTEVVVNQNNEWQHGPMIPKDEDTDEFKAAFNVWFADYISKHPRKCDRENNDNDMV